jgi:hypothetical protein
MALAQPQALCRAHMPRYTGAILALVLGSLLLRCLSLPAAQNANADAIVRQWAARDWLARPYFIAAGNWLPLHLYLLAWVQFLLPGVARSGIALNILLGALTILPLIRVVELEFGARPVALLAGLLFILFPLTSQLSLLSLSEVPFMLWLWTCLWALAEYERRVRSEHGNRALIFLLAAAVALNLASATRYESWFLAPFLALLFVRPLTRSALFLALALVFPAVWTAGNWLTYHTLSYAADWGRNLEMHRAVALPLSQRLIFVPGGLLLALNPIMAFFVLWGLLVALLRPKHTKPGAPTIQDAGSQSHPLSEGLGKGWGTGPFAAGDGRHSWWGQGHFRLAFLALPVAALVAANVVRSINPPLPRYLFIPCTLLLPYAALGLYRLWTVQLSGPEHYLLPVVAILSLPFMPYVDARITNLDLRPIPRADSQSQAVVNWLQAHLAPADGLILDSMGYREQWIASTLESALRHPWLVPEPGQRGSQPEAIAAQLGQVVQTQRPRYIIYSTDGALHTIFGPLCPKDGNSPVFTSYDLTICELHYAPAPAVP